MVQVDDVAPKPAILFHCVHNVDVPGVIMAHEAQVIRYYTNLPGRPGWRSCEPRPLRDAYMGWLMKWGDLKEFGGIPPLPEHLR